MEEAKAALRRESRRLRAMLSAGPEGEARSRRIQQRLMASRFWKECRRVLLYAAAKGEADTSLLISAALEEGRDVFLPRCRPGEAGGMDFIQHREGGALLPSRFGILEPELTPSSRLLQDGELAGKQAGGTLIVAPALAFDRSGFRLGYGGGYYDRLLSRSRCANVGLAFHALLFETLPRDAWDRPVSAVCTEETLLCP